MKRFWIGLLILLISTSAWSADKWRDGSTTFFDGDATLFNDVDTEVDEHMIDPLERFLINSDKRISLIWASSSTLTATAGSTVCSNSAGTLVEIRKNPSATTVTWANIDTGAEGNATYYVWANCDADATTATFKVSLSASAPASTTMYRLIGSFANTAGDIVRASIAAPAYIAPPSDSTGKPLVTAIFDYSTSHSSYTEKTGDLKIAFGIATLANGAATISNLPYTSATSYRVIAIRLKATNVNQAITVTGQTASTFSLKESVESSDTVNWITIGI